MLTVNKESELALPEQRWEWLYGCVMRNWRLRSTELRDRSQDWMIL